MLGVDRSRIVKSLLFVDEKGVPVLAIVTGDSMVDEEKLARVLGVKRVRKARPRAVRNITGYEVGALPPVGHKKPVKTVIDVKVMEKDVVYGGGGSVNKLLEISPRDIKKLTGALVADVSRA
ncbi:MAG TPA: aminoacyl-tRNA deacylase [Thermofilaceae archaeon]|nr:aminoacyl-tRNA deacylase [Thermofilaceae archaeon]